MKIIHQRSAFDCAFAALAMATQLPYESIASLFKLPGVIPPDACEALRFLGFTVEFRARPENVTEEWTLQPFAPRHAAWVTMPKQIGYRGTRTDGTPYIPCHVIAVLHDGTVLDPLQDEPQRWENYPRVACVIGIAGRPSRAARRAIPLKVRQGCSQSGHVARAVLGATERKGGHRGAATGSKAAPRPA